MEIFISCVVVTLAFILVIISLGGFEAMNKNYAISVLVFAGAMLMMGVVWPEPEPQFAERYIIADRGCNSCHIGR